MVIPNLFIISTNLFIYCQFFTLVNDALLMSIYATEKAFFLISIFELQ